MTAKQVSIKRPEYKSNKDHVFQISTLATFILQSNDCSILLRNGVREPLSHACTDLKSSNEICVTLFASFASSPDFAISQLNSNSNNTNI